MRITREVLLKNTRDIISQRTRADRSLLSVYLCGSMLEDEYLLGGAADIDLVFIHTDLVPSPREVIGLTDEIHLDIAHHNHRDYRQPRNLRVHPWLGPTMKDCKVMYDPQHFLDFTQASVRGQFERSDHVMERSRLQADHARQIWLEFHTTHPQSGPKEVVKYLRAVEHAANAVASLSGPPLTERRFLTRFAERAAALGRPGLHAGLIGLLGGANTEGQGSREWISAWRAAYDAVPVDLRPVRLHQSRRLYYQNAFQSLVESGQPLSVLWPLLYSWTQSALLLPEDDPALQLWNDTLTRLGLLGAGFDERVAALDAYLDMVEETLDQWARDNGAE